MKIEETSKIKVLYSNRKLLKEKNDLDIEKARIFVVKIFKSDVLQERQKKKDIDSTLEGEKLV